MKNKRLKNYLKLGILLFGILAIFQNCQKEDSFENKFNRHSSQDDVLKIMREIPMERNSIVNKFHSLYSFAKQP